MEVNALLRRSLPIPGQPQMAAARLVEGGGPFDEGLIEGVIRFFNIPVSAETAAGLEDLKTTLSVLKKRYKRNEAVQQAISGVQRILSAAQGLAPEMRLLLEIQTLHEVSGLSTIAENRWGPEAIEQGLAALREKQANWINAQRGMRILEPEPHRPVLLLNANELGQKFVEEAFSDLQHESQEAYELATGEIFLLEGREDFSPDTLALAELAHPGKVLLAAWLLGSGELPLETKAMAKGILVEEAAHHRFKRSHPARSLLTPEGKKFKFKKGLQWGYPVPSHDPYIYLLEIDGQLHRLEYWARAAEASRDGSEEKAPLQEWTQGKLLDGSGGGVQAGVQALRSIVGEEILTPAGKELVEAQVRRLGALKSLVQWGEGPAAGLEALDDIQAAVSADLRADRTLERNLRAAVQAAHRVASEFPREKSFAWKKAGIKGESAFISFEIGASPATLWFDGRGIREAAVGKEEVNGQMSATALLGGQVGPKRFSREFLDHHPDEPSDYAITFTTGQILDQLTKRSGRVTLMLTSKPGHPEDNKREVAQRFARGWIGRYDGDDPMTFLWMIPEQVDIYLDEASDPGEKLRRRLTGAGMTVKEVFATPEEAGAAAAAEVVDEWERKASRRGGQYTLGLVTGSTPKPFLAALMPELQKLLPVVRSQMLKGLQIVVPDDHVERDAAGQYHNIPRDRLDKKNQPVSAYAIRQKDFVEPANQGLPADRPGMSLDQVIVPEVGKVESQLESLQGIDRYFLTFGPQHVFMQFAGEAEDVRLYSPEELSGGKRVVVIQNSEEPAGVFGQVPSYLVLRVQVIQAHDPGQGRLIPDDPADWDWENIAGLVVMGGPPNVYENDTYPWLDNLTALLRHTAGRQIPTLGICLGCQLLARAVGGKVTPDTEAPRGVEKGILPISVTEHGSRHPFLSGFAQIIEIAGLHGDTIFFPEGAGFRLADGTSVPIRMLLQGREVPWQAFSAGDRVVGVLGHLEADEETLDQWLQVPDNAADAAIITRMQKIVRRPGHFAQRRGTAAGNWWKIVEASWKERERAAASSAGLEAARESDEELARRLQRPEVTGGKGIRGRTLTGIGRKSYDALVRDQFPSKSIPRLANGLSLLLSDLNMQPAFTWADVAAGAGVALREAAARFPNLSPVGVDIIRWDAEQFEPNILQELQEQAAAVGQSLFSGDLPITQANALDVDLRPLAKSPIRLITMMNALAYNKDPLRILANLFNQLEPDGVLLANLYIPAEHGKSDALAQFYGHLCEYLRAQGVDADFKVTDFRKMGKGQRNFEGDEGPFPEYGVGMVLRRRAEQRLAISREPQSEPFTIQTVRPVVYEVAWYGGDPAKAVQVISPSLSAEQTGLEDLEAAMGKLREFTDSIFGSILDEMEKASPISRAVEMQRERFLEIGVSHDEFGKLLFPRVVRVEDGSLKQPSEQEQTNLAQFYLFMITVLTAAIYEEYEEKQRVSLPTVLLRCYSKVAQARVEHGKAEGGDESDEPAEINRWYLDLLDDPKVGAVFESFGEGFFELFGLPLQSGLEAEERDLANRWLDMVLWNLPFDRLLEEPIARHLLTEDPPQQFFSDSGLSTEESQRALGMLSAAYGEALSEFPEGAGWVGESHRFVHLVEAKLFNLFGGRPPQTIRVSSFHLDELETHRKYFATWRQGERQKARLHLSHFSDAVRQRVPQHLLLRMPDPMEVEKEYPEEPFWVYEEKEAFRDERGRVFQMISLSAVYGGSPKQPIHYYHDTRPDDTSNDPVVVVLDESLYQRYLRQRSSGGLEAGGRAATWQEKLDSFQSALTQIGRQLERRNLTGVVRDLSQEYQVLEGAGISTAEFTNWPYSEIPADVSQERGGAENLAAARFWLLYSLTQAITQAAESKTELTLDAVWAKYDRLVRFNIPAWVPGFLKRHQINLRDRRLLDHVIEKFQIPLVSAAGAEAQLIRPFGNTGLKFHLLGIGTAWLGRPWPPGNASYEYPGPGEIGSYLDLLFDRLCRDPDARLMIDTAASYGFGEEYIGNYLRNRSHVLSRAFLATKWGELQEYDDTQKRPIDQWKFQPDYSISNLETSALQSAKRLGRIDLLYLHLVGTLPGESNEVARARALRVLRDSSVMDRMVRMRTDNEHGIQLLGASISDEQVFVTAAEERLLDRFDVLQMPAPILLNQPELVQGLHDAGKAIVINSTVRRGDKAVSAHERYRPLIGHPAVDMILLGARKPEDYQSNLNYVEQQLLVLGGLENEAGVFRSELQQIQRRKETDFRLLFEFLKEGAEQKLAAVRAQVSSLEVAQPVREEITQLLSASGRLNQDRRGKIASVLLYLKNNFGLLPPGFLPLGKVFLMIGYHQTRDQGMKLFEEVKSRLPEVPSDPKSPEEIPELVFHMEDIHPDDLTQLLLPGVVESVDDHEVLGGFYKRIRPTLVDRAAREARIQARGEIPAEPMFKTPFHRVFYEEIAAMVRRGYRVKVFHEDPEPSSWWRWNRSEGLGREAGLAFLKGEVEKVEALSERCDRMRYEADQDRDLRHEGPAVNKRVEKYPRATHFVVRGLLHSQLAGKIRVEPPRKEVVRVIPDPSDPESFLSPMALLHELRRRGEIAGPQGEEMERTLRLRDVLANILLTPAVQTGRYGVDSIKLLNPVLARLSADDIRRLIRSFQGDPLPIQDRLYETHHRLKTMFPGLLEDGSELDRLLSESIQEASTNRRGSPRVSSTAGGLEGKFHINGSDGSGAHPLAFADHAVKAVGLAADRRSEMVLLGDLIFTSVLANGGAPFANAQDFVARVSAAISSNHSLSPYLQGIKPGELETLARSLSYGTPLSDHWRNIPWHFQRVQSGMEAGNWKMIGPVLADDLAGRVTELAYTLAENGPVSATIQTPHGDYSSDTGSTSIGPFGDWHESLLIEGLRKSAAQSFPSDAWYDAFGRTLQSVGINLRSADALPEGWYINALEGTSLRHGVSHVTVTVVPFLPDELALGVPMPSSVESLDMYVQRTLAMYLTLAKLEEAESLRLELRLGMQKRRTFNFTPSDRMDDENQQELERLRGMIGEDNLEESARRRIWQRGISVQKEENVYTITFAVNESPAGGLEVVTFYDGFTEAGTGRVSADLELLTGAGLIRPGERRAVVNLPPAALPKVGVVFIREDLPRRDFQGIEEVYFSTELDRAQDSLSRMPERALIILPDSVPAGSERIWRPQGGPILVLAASGLEQADESLLGALAAIARNLKDQVLRVGLEEWANRVVSSTERLMSIGL